MVTPASRPVRSTTRSPAALTLATTPASNASPVAWSSGVSGWGRTRHRASSSLAFSGWRT